jgi:hypothetical protein
VEHRDHGHADGSIHSEEGNKRVTVKTRADSPGKGGWVVVNPDAECPQAGSSTACVEASTVFSSLPGEEPAAPSTSSIGQPTHLTASGLLEVYYSVSSRRTGALIAPPSKGGKKTASAQN